MTSQYSWAYDHLSDIADGYDAVLCDVWGVIHGGHGLVAQALKALEHYRASGGKVILVSNSPHRAQSLANYLYQMGVQQTHFDDVVSSGEAIFEMLCERAPGQAYKLGPDWDDALYEGTGLSFTYLEQSQFICCTGLVDYESETPDDYADLLKQAADLDLEMICANPDKWVRLGDRLVYCAGALAERYTALGGRVIMGGKPYESIYALAYRALHKHIDRPVDKSRVLAIGDGPQTDITGAEREGLDAFFITDGVVLDEFQNGFDLTHAKTVLSEHKTQAKYFAPVLSW